MSAEKLLDEFASVGIHLLRDGDIILADVVEGADLVLFRGHITENKPALLAALRLREQIVVAASVAQAAFDRRQYDALWERWHELQEQNLTRRPATMTNEG
jgi:hypothetical protein